MFDEWAATQSDTKNSRLGMFVLMASPKSRGNIPILLGWLVQNRRMKPPIGGVFWMSFEDRGPKRHAVSTMTPRAKGGTALQDVMWAKFQDSTERCTRGGGSPKGASIIGRAVFRQQGAQPIPSKPGNLSHTHLKRLEAACERGMPN